MLAISGTSIFELIDFAISLQGALATRRTKEERRGSEYADRLALRSVLESKH